MTTTAQAGGLWALPTPRASTQQWPAPALAVVLFLACAFAALAGWAVHVGPGGLDGWVLAWVAGHRSEWPAVTALARAVTRFGDPSPAAAIVVVVALLLAWMHHRGVSGIGRGEGLFWVAVAAGGHALVMVLKACVRRERPPLAHRLVVETSFSFPSGHSNYAAVMLALAVGLLAWRLGTAPRWRRAVAGGTLLVLALLVAGSRVWLGVHYPSDVAGGLVLGTTWVLGACQVRAGWAHRAARLRDALAEPHLGAVGEIRLAYAPDPHTAG